MLGETKMRRIANITLSAAGNISESSDGEIEYRNSNHTSNSVWDMGSWNVTHGSREDISAWNASTPVQSLTDDWEQSTTEPSKVQPQSSRSLTFPEIVPILILCCIVSAIIKCCCKNFTWTTLCVLGVKGCVHIYSCLRKGCVHIYSCLRDCFACSW